MKYFHNPLGLGPVKATPPAQKRPAQPKPPASSKPDKNVNQGAMPNMMGDVKKNPKPTIGAAQMIAPSTAPARAAGSPDQRSGLDQAMAALADKMHPAGR